MSKVLGKMLALRVERALENLNRAGALLTDIKEGERSICFGATICELLKFAQKHAGEVQNALLRIDHERIRAQKAGRK